MGNSSLRVGLVGCGSAARIHLDRLLATGRVEIVGFADPDAEAAASLASRVPASKEGSTPTVPAFADHRELLKQTAPEILAIFTPHLAHYRPAMDALQAGCHVFIEKPLSTNVQEAADIVGLARGRNRKVGVGHQYRLCPSLVEARARIAAGAIGRVRLVTATLAQSWLETHRGSENSWRFDPKVSGGGILADAGDHIVDALIWTTGKVAVEAAAVQDRLESGLDLVTAAAIRLAGGTPATLAISGVASGPLFELTYFGEEGRLRANDRQLLVEREGEAPTEVDLPGPIESIDGNFVAAVADETPLCCPADEAIETVRLLEAIARSAATGEVVRLA